MGHSDADTLSKQAAQHLLDTGLRNLWYPVAPSWQVAVRRSASRGSTSASCCGATPKQIRMPLLLETWTETVSQTYQ